MHRERFRCRIGAHVGIGLRRALVLRIVVHVQAHKGQQDANPLSYGDILAKPCNGHENHKYTLK